MTSKVVYLVTPQKVGKFFDAKIDQLLSKEEIVYFSSLTYEKRKKDWLAGRLATKNFVKFYLSSKHNIDSDIREICVYNGESGEPYWKLRDYDGCDLASKLRISIAHTNGHAVATGEDTASIGIDIEPIRNIPSGFLNYFLNGDEVRTIKRCFLNLNEGATLYWTLKEAAGKSLRVGLRIPPKSMEVKFIDQKEPTLFNILINKDRKQRRVLSGTYTKSDKFLVSVVTTSPNRHLSLSVKVI